MEDKLIIGICGKPCSGKTVLASQIKHDLLIDCDKLSDQVFNENTEYIKKILALDYVPTKKDVADIIFNKHWYSYKKFLMYNAFTTFMWKKITKKVISLIENTDAKIILIDAPLLKEAKLDALCDTVISVDTKMSLRIERAKKRGWTSKELLRRDSFFKN